MLTTVKANGTYITNDKERLFFNSVSSGYTRNQYKIHLQKYLDVWGYKDSDELLSKDPSQIENQLIDSIITCDAWGNNELCQTCCNFMQNFRYNGEY
jgi:hypothetical protein